MHGEHPLRVPLAIQAGFALTFLVVALALRGPLAGRPVRRRGDALLGPVAAVLAYAASYFARGFLAGHQCFGLYGGLVLLESLSRCCFPSPRRSA